MKCSFCKGSVAAGSGKMFIKNTGEVFYFCSSKCEKNFILGRESKKRKWSRGKKIINN